MFSSKWNKCKFMCPVCNKVSNEKRYIRSHTMSAHSTSLDIIVTMRFILSTYFALSAMLR